MTGKRIAFSGEEAAWLEANQKMILGDYHRAFSTTFGRTDVSYRQLNELRRQKGWRTGRSGRFEKGSVPVNKGVPCPPGFGGRHPNSLRAGFKKGDVLGRAGELLKPIGAERLSKEGYIERKVHNGLPKRSRWRQVHHLRWVAQHGEVPKGFCLKCLDGDRRNTEPSNWELVPRSLLPHLNGIIGRGYDAAPGELKPAIMAVAKLEHMTRQMKGRI